MYFAYGAACSEVTIDTLTGEMRVDRVDILHITRTWQFALGNRLTSR